MSVGSDSYEKQTRAVVLYGDIRGYSTWERQITNPDIEFKPLMRQIDVRIQTFVSDMQCFAKDDLGDGFLAVLELAPGHSCSTVIRFLRAACRLTNDLIGIIEAHPWPRPDGYRVRLACGHLWKKTTLRGPDVVGRAANLAHKTLNVVPDEPVVAHRSVTELFSPVQAKKAGLVMNKLEITNHNFGIEKTDLKSLVSVRLPDARSH